MTSRGKWSLAWLVLGIGTAAVLYFAVLGASRAVEESGQRSLILQAERQLARHYALHDRYPDALEGMEFQFTDGANAATLARLKYVTDGAHYRLVTPSDFDGKEISACR